MVPLYLPHFNLQPYNTLASPVFAQYFVSVSNQEELLDAIKFSRDQQLPLMVLGGGSNIVLRDDFAGLVIYMQLKGREIVREDDESFYVQAAAGENWHDFVEYCLDEGFYGLENLSLIPGTVGAAPIQNIGAYGVELKDVFEELTALEIRSGVSITFTKEACQFEYRDSVFKHALKDQFIITSVTFKLAKSSRLDAQYPALAAELSGIAAEEITPSLVSDLVCQIRRRKLPDPIEIPNVGSFFKNPIVTKQELQRIQEIAPDVVFYSVGDSVKLAAGWLIDKAGWRGYLGQAGVHAAQALVLTNPFKHKGDCVLDLADQIKRSVEATFGVALEQEPRTYP